jgi:hypothetical protein
MKEFEMTQEQLDKLLDSMKIPPMIMLQCGEPPSQQQMANAAWEKLGEEMGFSPFSVRPSSKGDRFFTAMPIS